MRRILLPALLTILVLFIFSAPAHAQDATPEVTPVVTEAPTLPPADTGGIPGAETPEQPQGETLVGRLAGYVAAFIAGVTATATAGWLALPRLLSQVRNDRAMLALIEGLTNSAPKDLVDKAITVGKAAGDLSAILEEVTDGVPVSSKSPVS